VAWTALTDPSGGGSGNLTVLFQQGGSIYLGGIGKVWVSSDHGGSWSEIGAGGLPATAQMSAIALAPDGTLCIGHNNSGGVNPASYYWSGSAWVLATGIPTNLTLKVSALKVAYGKLFAATAFQGEIYVSTNNGHSYSLYATNPLIRDTADPQTGAIWSLGLISGGRLAASGEFGTAGGNGGIFRDPRTGGQWVGIGGFNVDGFSANEKPWCSATGKDGTIYAYRKHSSGDRVWKSTKDGVWTKISTGITQNQVGLNMVLDATGTLWYSQQPNSGDGHTYRSVNLGASWATYESGLPASTWAIYRGIVADDAYVYALMNNAGGIYRAPAGG